MIKIKLLALFLILFSSCAIEKDYSNYLMQDRLWFHDNGEITAGDYMGTDENGLARIRVTENGDTTYMHVAETKLIKF